MFRNILLILLIAATQGCAYFRDTDSPVSWAHYKTSSEKTKNLIVFLPGIRNDMYSFEKAGFFENIDQYHPEFDVITVNVHLGHYLHGVMVKQLHKNVIQSAKAMGYERIVLAGISLGGYGSLWYNHEHGNEIKGIMLFSPYLGDKNIIDTIKLKGGVNNWKMTSRLEDANFGEKVWHWIYDDISGKKSNTLLVYGQDDRYVEAERLLATYLPESQVIESVGSHDWVTWRALWFELLKSRQIERLFN